MLGKKHSVEKKHTPKKMSLYINVIPKQSKTNLRLKGVDYIDRGLLQKIYFFNTC